MGTLAPEGVGGQGGSYLHGSVQSPADSETSVAHLISSDSDSEDEDNGDNNDSGDEEGTLSNEDYARSGRRRNSRRDRKNGKVDDEDEGLDEHDDAADREDPLHRRPSVHDPRSTRERGYSTTQCSRPSSARAPVLLEQVGSCLLG